MKKWPEIIQGGMGIAVSDWRLAKSVASLGQLGVVSGTAINSVLVRRLQDGDPQGDTRRALKAFPNQKIAEKILEQYFIEGGKPPEAAYKRSPLYQIQSSLPLLQLTVVANFVEIWLAKEGHSGLVGLNLLEKIQMPNLASIYGALLAKVDCVIMGAGIPREIPGALDLLAEHKPANLKISVEGSTKNEALVMTFDPVAVMEGLPELKLERPWFFPIVSSSVLAASLQKKSTGVINGFIVESPLAGGHNAPPRGPMNLDEGGEPIYGPRDVVSLSDMKALRLPFWMAGAFATPKILREVQSQGAQGIQVGTLFAFAQESGLDPKLRETVIERIAKGDHPDRGWIFTDPRSSPTGFPFKAVRLTDSVSEQPDYEARKRICDLGYLRHVYEKPDGTPGYRCPAEPVQDFVKKGGDIQETVGRKCLCNALMANISMPQKQSWGDLEKPLLTAGNDLNELSRILKPGQNSYSASEVLIYLLSQ